ncbi:MAG: tail fiber domain-containing protein [Pseudomonadota bacterium]|nr:tail fiber domain-containing protein [Pseudomonadota bacterium]
MVLSKLCLPVAVSAVALGAVFSINSAKASNLLQCQAGDKKSAISCCMKSTKVFKPGWFIQAGGSCSNVVSCGGGLKAIRRCRVEIPITTGGSAPATPKVMISDMRLKKDIIRVGTTVHQLPLYDFSYIDQPGRFQGVMAQDVLKVMPEAVSIGADGFYRVNYTMLGIEMKRLQ